MPLSEETLCALLHDVVANGGGVTLELDDSRFRLVRREGKFELKKVEKRRPSSLPPSR